MKLKEMRITQGLSQSELAKLSGISVRTIQQYDQGNRDINRAELKTLLNLSNALTCRVIDILDDRELIDLINRSQWF